MTRWYGPGGGSSGTSGGGVVSGGSGGSGGTTVIRDVSVVYVTETVTGNGEAQAGATGYFADASAGQINIVLPDPDPGLQFFFKKTDKTSNKVIVLGNIDDMSEVWLTQVYDAIHVIGDESSWRIV